MKETLRVLVTDDEEGMRFGIARALRNFSAAFADLDIEVLYTVDLADTGELALAKIAEQPCDILLLDYKLPGISGLDVLGRLRQEHPDILTIMITAYASIETAITATKNGAYDFLAKPFTPEELKAALRKATHHLILQRQAARHAEEKRRLRFEFLSVLAHELKAPLGAIEGYLNVVHDGMATDPETLNHVIERCLIRVQGMRKLIYDLLDLTRIESGTKVREIRDVDLVEIARQSIETLEPDAQARQIKIELCSPPSVPFVADRSEIEIIMNNLVSNAVKYNRDGGQVDVRIAICGDQAEIAVRDTGIGLTPQEAGKLFQSFVRIKNAKTTKILGSGIGLSTVKRIANLYGGDARVESVPDVGSTFFVTLRSQLPPAQAADEAQSQSS